VDCGILCLGREVKKNDEEAVRYYKLSSDQGDLDKQYKRM
jgi:TPR repeat protein